jgi:hypothetical protein
MSCRFALKDMSRFHFILAFLYSLKCLSLIVPEASYTLFWRAGKRAFNYLR